MILLLTWFLTIEQARAHAHFKVNGIVPPRSGDTALKTGPCGNIARTSAPKVLQAGSDLTVEWEETIDHPGRFEIYFSPANDTGWKLLKQVQDTQNTPVNGAPHAYATQITLPNEACTACTLQLIQVMTENPSAPSYYYSCADIQLKATSSPAPTPTPSPGCAP